MEIVKQLNLNGNPQVVPNGSLMYAKNIKLSDDGTYITNDDGFDTAFAEAEPSRDNLKVSSVVGTFCTSIIEHGTGDGQNLVGYINCPNEIVLFVHKKYSYIDPDTEEEVEVDKSEIYRAVELKYDEDSVVEGETVTIHADKFALYKVSTSWKYDNGKIIGTYTYNVYNHLIIAIAESDSYTIEIDSETEEEIHVPFDKQLMTIDLNDSSELDLIDKYSGAPNIPLCNLSLNGKVKGKAMPHGLYYFFIRYFISDKLYSNWFPIGAPQYALSLDYKTIINHRYATIADGSTTKTTHVSTLVNTDKDSYYNFNFTIEFSDTYNYKGYQIGYILQTEDTAVARIWNEFLFDKLSDNFTFNGGFIEESDIESFTNNVLNLYNIKALTSYNNKLYIANFKETDYNIDLQSYADTINAIQVKHKVDLDTTESSSTIMTTWTYNVNGKIAEITVPSDVTSIYLKEFPDLETYLAEEIYWYRSYDGSHFYDYLGQDVRLVFSTEYLDLVPSLNINDDSQYRFRRAHNGYWFGYHTYSSPGGGAMEPNGTLDYDKLSISKEEGVKNYSTFNTDNIIKTLMPHEVYSFYVHYVRKDGSFTNGLPLKCKTTVDSYFYKQIKDLSAAELSTLHLTDISTIEEIKDKYVYELYFPETISSDLTEPFSPFESKDGRKLFRTGTGMMTYNNTSYILRIGVRFYDITYPPGYVGCFFSYEKPQSLSVYQAVVTDKLTNNNNILVKANDVEAANIRYDGTLFVPHHKVNIATGDIQSIDSEPWYTYINNAAPVLSNATISFSGNLVDRTGLHGGIVMNLSKDNSTSYQPDEYIVGDILTFNRSVYSSETKELIPFGRVTNESAYGEIIDESDTKINYNMNYPSFIVKDNLLVYKSPIYIDESLATHEIVDGIIDPESFYDGFDYAKINSIWKFSNVNLLALTIKKEPEEAVGVIANDKNTINIVVKPVNASDLFKIDSCYYEKLYKSYTSYNKYLKTEQVFTNIVRTSYPIRNESGINSWRMLDLLNYYVIDNSNGEIVNMFGAGTSFFIHTKNNLLVTSSNAKITADNTTIHLQENNIFDVPPSEIFTSDLGYGGIKYQECQLFSQFGYIWYDTERYKLFRYDNGRLIDINSGIDELIKKYKFEKCYINIDNENNRIFFAFAEGNGGYITLGYDTLGNKWLSLYDFTFNKAIHTANCAIFGIDFEAFLYKYSKSATICDYKSLARYNDDLPFYGTQQVGSYPIIQYCCFDIIFNASYTMPKVLDSISWIHEYITRNTLDNNHPAELKIINRTIENRISDLNGVIIDVYSDSVDSGLLNVTPSSGDKLNDVTNTNSYKYPYYNKGIWNYSYFRNNIVTPVTNAELEALAQAYGVNVNTLKNVYKITDKNGNQLYVDGNPAYTSSDLRSLIYGKYIAVRFIFKTSNKLKFDNLVFNLQKY